MTVPQVATRKEWLAARLELLAKEKELSRSQDAVHAQRQALPMVRIDKEYVFDSPSGKVGLSDLFEGRRQLIVYHFMWHEHGKGTQVAHFLESALFSKFGLPAVYPDNLADTALS